MSKTTQTARPSTIHVGFVPLTDCAPIVMAHALNLFAKYGLQVVLHRELGWASVRDKIAYGELDASHGLAAAPLAMALGLGSVRSEAVTALVLSHHGNGITLARHLRARGVADGHSLRAEIRKRRHERTLTFAVVSPFSSHRHLLRKWLCAHRIDPDRDVRMVVVPPPQMVANLEAGNLDGCCVGEPWNSAAVAAGAGVCVATSASLDPGHPEKVLMVREGFARERRDDHIALAAAVLEACEWCGVPENHLHLIDTLARPEYVGVSSKVLRPGVKEFCIFSGPGVNEPSGEKAAWVLQLIRGSGYCPPSSLPSFSIARRTFRADLFAQAVQLRSTTRAISTASTTHDHETELALV